MVLYSRCVLNISCHRRQTACVPRVATTTPCFGSTNAVGNRLPAYTQRRARNSPQNIFVVASVMVVVKVTRIIDGIDADILSSGPITQVEPKRSSRFGRFRLQHSEEESVGSRVSQHAWVVLKTTNKTVCYFCLHQDGAVACILSFLLQAYNCSIVHHSSRLH